MASAGITMQDSIFRTKLSTTSAGILLKMGTADINLALTAICSCTRHFGDKFLNKDANEPAKRTVSLPLKKKKLEFDKEPKHTTSQNNKD